MRKKIQSVGNYVKREKIDLLITILLICTPLMSGILFCAKDFRTIFDIYIPLGGWSDEITYYQQIKGMVTHGIPVGYFGYNQSRAMYGPFSVWGIFPLIPYYCLAKIGGWTYQSPIYYNILFCSIALAFMIRLTKPKRQKRLMIMIVWCMYYFLNRHVLSGVVEALYISLLLGICSCGVYLFSPAVRNDKTRIFSSKKDSGIIAICTFLTFYASIGRPYYAVFFLIPFWKVIRERRVWGCILLPIVALLSIVVFVGNSELFCSKYFNNMLQFQYTFETLFEKVKSNCIEIAKLVWYAIRYRNDSGWYFVIFFVALGIMMISCVSSVLRKKELPIMYCCSIVGSILILLSFMVIYNLSICHRHLLAINVALIVVIILESRAEWGFLFAMINLVAILLIGDFNPLPYKDNAYAEYMKELEQTFARLVVPTNELSYDNVVGMPTSDILAADPRYTCVSYYGLLYAMPGGIGVSLDIENMYYGDFDNIKAKYIMCHPGGKIRLLLEEHGMECIYEDEQLTLLQK